MVFCARFVRMELMDYLDSIDCSLEDFQAMLYGKQFGIDFDALEVKWQHLHTKSKTFPQIVFTSKLHTATIIYNSVSSVC